MDNQNQQSNKFTVKQSESEEVLTEIGYDIGNSKLEDD